MYNELTLREAVDSDSLLILGWRNEASVRKMAFNSDVISLVDHSKWFKEKIHEPNCLILILQKAGEDIGQIRFDITPSEEAEVSLSIVKGERGKGYGKTLLRMGRDYLFMKYPNVRKVIGRIKKNNIASINAFSRSGFRTIDRFSYKGHEVCKMTLEHNSCEKSS